MAELWVLNIANNLISNYIHLNKPLFSGSIPAPASDHLLSSTYVIRVLRNWPIENQSENTFTDFKRVQARSLKSFSAVRESRMLFSNPARTNRAKGGGDRQCWAHGSNVTR
jgi:hypothetical protein